MNFKRDHSKVRQAHCQLLEMVDDGYLDAKTVLEAALGWMEDHWIEDMAYANEFFDRDDDEDELDDE